MSENDELILDDEYNSNKYYFTQYDIDGFRSLRSFNVRLEEGLNVFVGPNGAGKTNFIEFLDFLTLVSARGASGAISQIGGIARVFSQETLKNKIPRIRARVCGLADVSVFTRPGEDRTLFRYEYEVDIRYSKFHSAVFIANEKIKFKTLFWRDLAVFVDRTVGSIELRRRSPITDAPIEWEVGKRLLSRGMRNPFRFDGRMRAWRSAENKDAFLQAPVLDVDESIFSVRGLYPAIDAVRESLARGRSFNLVPAVARAPDDLSRPPVIASDGAGLSATLYHMQQARKVSPKSTAVRSRRFDKYSLDTIVNWTNLVLPELSDISTSADPHTGKYLSYLVIPGVDTDLRIPLQSASDGTVKWLSFVALILTRGSVYSIEEPENFLHPEMQRALVSLIRENMSTDHPGHFILSTHSETIINQCRPEELLLFKFEDGHTTCRRLSSPEAVEEQINQTGFGLGYYYAANAIS